jgi:hypothetical protein
MGVGAVQSMQKHQLTLLGLVIFILLSAWCPWLTESAAEQRVLGTFQSGQKGMTDGCGFACKDCGSKRAEKRMFGYFVDIEYACGLLPKDAPEYHRTERRFVTFLGTVHPVGAR